MNEADIKDGFALAVAQPDVDRIDTEAVLRGGRRRHRIRIAATVGTVMAVVAVAGSLVVGGTRQLSGIADPAATASGCQDLTGTQSGSMKDQQLVDNAARSLLAAASALPANNLSNLIAHTADLKIEVLWVGPIPQALTDIATSEARERVTVEFGPAKYTQRQMQSAQAVAFHVLAPIGDPASHGLMIASASSCPDGSGIKITLAQKANGRPAASVPPAFAAAIQARVGEMPVSVQPGGVAIADRATSP